MFTPGDMVMKMSQMVFFFFLSSVDDSNNNNNNKKQEQSGKKYLGGSERYRLALSGNGKNY